MSVYEKLLKPSVRAIQWKDFCFEVESHIEKYTVPQYGDAGEDNVTSWTAEDCLKQVEKYYKRRGKNSRAGQDKLDLLKMAHYIQMAWTKSLHTQSEPPVLSECAGRTDDTVG